MSKKLILTSLTAIAFAMPAMATPTNTSPTFPYDDLMQEDYTYQNQANYTNMGLYEGTVTANAEYEWDIIPIAAGTYLPGGQISTTQCTAGYYCPGVAKDKVHRTPHYQTVQEGDQGLNACPNGYPTSAAGADAATDCYRTCTTTDVAHSAAVTGMMYYNGTSGDGVNACEPTEQNGCVNGYHYKAAVAAPDLTTAIGNVYSTGYTSNDSSGNEKYSSFSMSNSIISGDPMAFAVDYGDKGMIKGHGRCSTRGVSSPWKNSLPYTFSSDHFTSTLPDASGGNCYCQLDGYTPLNSSMTTLSAPWVFQGGGFGGDDGGVSGCASNCANECAIYLQYYSEQSLAFRAAVFGSLGASPAMCEGNEITINWGDVDPNYEGDNNEGTAIYGEDIRTPVKAATKPGQTFKGWKFVKPTTPSQGD